MAGTCTHTDAIETTDASSNGCYDCLLMGGTWVHLRRCVTCGHVGCCDSSPNRHATAHFETAGHPLMQSYEPGEDWYWCYLDLVAFDTDEPGTSPSHS